jgi:hypothetical protein
MSRRKLRVDTRGGSVVMGAMTWSGGHDRYLVESAPPGLCLTQAFANCLALKAGRDQDLLPKPTAAQPFPST